MFPGVGIFWVSLRSLTRSSPAEQARNHGRRSPLYSLAKSKECGNMLLDACSREGFDAYYYAHGNFVAPLAFRYLPNPTQIPIMKKLLIVPLSILALATSSQAAVYTLSGGMDELQAGSNGGFGTTGSTGTGIGTITGSYDDVTNLLDYTITWSGLTGPATSAHFHSAAPGVNGGVALGISSLNPSVGSGISVSETGETNLLGGLWYVNVHTAAFGSGEIRGQVIVTAVPEPGTSVLALGALGALFLRRKR